MGGRGEKRLKRRNFIEWMFELKWDVKAHQFPTYHSAYEESGSVRLAKIPSDSIPENLRAMKRGTWSSSFCLCLEQCLWNPVTSSKEWKVPIPDIAGVGLFTEVNGSFGGTHDPELNLDQWGQAGGGKPWRRTQCHGRAEASART